MNVYKAEMRYIYFRRAFFFEMCEEILPNDTIPYSIEGEYNWSYYDSVYNAVDDQVIIALTGGFPEY